LLRYNNGEKSKKSGDLIIRIPRLYSTSMTAHAFNVRFKRALTTPLFTARLFRTFRFDFYDGLIT
jgi:hypothetical protein